MKKNLRLFKIEAGGDPVYFDNKRLAKRERDLMHDQGKTGVVVMRGPDHRRGESFNVSSQTERSHGRKHARPVSTRG